MIEFTPLSPIFLSIGSLKLHYYGLMYVFAFSFAYLILPHLFKTRNVNIKKKEFEDLFFWGAVGAILGGRLFYVLFYNFSHFLNQPLDILAVWKGGMASHGGFIGAALAVFLVCRKYKMKFLQITDTIVIPIGIGLMFGRLGNLINGELFGRATNLPWCINFKNAKGCRHPSQIYAMIKNMILFLTMFSLRKTKWKDGMLSFLFISLYASLRFIVGFFREADSQIGYLSLGLSQGQWISVIMFLVGVLGMGMLSKKD